MHNHVHTFRDNVTIDSNRKYIITISCCTIGLDYLVILDFFKLISVIYCTNKSVFSSNKTVIVLLPLFDQKPIIICIV